MLNHIKPENLLFLDIETVPQCSEYADADEIMQNLWNKKARLIAPDCEDPAEVYERAGIYAEFGKIVCISVGVVTNNNGERTVRLKSFAADDEKKLLRDFGTMLDGFARKKEFFLCAHNGKEFDFPYIARRMLINGLSLPDPLDIAGKKPWEMNFIDTLELWKFGDFRHYTSLELLAGIFGIPTPKDDIDGSMVASVYYQEKDLPRIATYCEKDVLTTIQLFLKFKGEELVKEENVIIVDDKEGKEPIASENTSHS